jgi:DNA-binding HxlR family transcriptional regulator
MTTHLPDGRRSDCPINTALEMVGDSWSLLIVRDLMFKGRSTFSDFANAEEKIASNILTDRLQRLEANGIITKLKDPSDARRYVYRLTEKGIDLAPMLLEMILWADRYAQTAAPPEVVHQMTHHREEFLASVRRGWEQRRG